MKPHRVSSVVANALLIFSPLFDLHAVKSCEYFFLELSVHWFEEDTGIDLESFDLNEPSPEPQVGSKINKEDAEDVECRAIVWWLLAFTCIYETPHSLSLRALQWLLLFFATLLSVLGKFSTIQGNETKA